MKIKRFCILLATLACAGVAHADDSGLPPDVFAESRYTKLTRADWDKAISKLPIEKRQAFAMSPKRIEELLNQVLVMKTFAAQARAANLPPDTKDGGEADDVAYANARLKQIDSDAGKEFDARGKQNEAAAKERFAVTASRYVEPAQYLLSDILIAFDRHGGASGAEEFAKSTRARVAAGADFAAVAKEVSDGTTRKEGGALPWLTLAQMDPHYREAVQLLVSAGDVSEPVVTRRGYHILRLEQRRPERQKTFDEAKNQVIADMREQFIAQKRDEVIRAIREDKTIKVNHDALDALVVKVPEEGFKPKLPAKGATAPAPAANGAAASPEASAAPK
jgi:hypothetical protein